MQGSYGAWLQGGSNNTLRGLRLRDLGSGGMRIGEGSVPSAQNSIVDCSIRDGGHVFFAGAGIHATRTDGNLIEGNTIAGFAASGVIIRIGAGNMIQNNNVSNLGLGLLSDLGGVCLSYGTQGSVAEGNLVHPGVHKQPVRAHFYLDRGFDYPGHVQTSRCGEARGYDYGRRRRRGGGHDFDKRRGPRGAVHLRLD